MRKLIFVLGSVVFAFGFLSSGGSSDNPSAATYTTADLNGVWTFTPIPQGRQTITVVITIDSHGQVAAYSNLADSSERLDEPSGTSIFNITSEGAVSGTLYLYDKTDGAFTVSLTITMNSAKNQMTKGTFTSTTSTLSESGTCTAVRDSAFPVDEGG